MRRPLCIVCLVFVMIVIFIMECFPYTYSFSDDINGEKVCIEGKVSYKETKQINGQTSYIIYLKQIKSQSFSDNDISIQTQFNKMEGAVCYMSENTYVPNLGSLVCMEGTINTFREPTNPGEFNEAFYYKIKDMDVKLYDAALVAYSQKYSLLDEKLFRLKEYFCALLDEYFKEEYRGIAKAILFAMNGELDKEVKSLYQRNGVLHILCVSGTHVSILGMGLYKLLQRIRIPKVINVIVCVGCMVLYGLMIGMGSSVFRAIFMFSMRLVAKLIGRTYDLLTATSIGGICILLEQPLYMYHSGFLLSFLSVISLGAFDPIFPEKICKIPWINKRLNDFLQTSMIWVFTLPIYGLYYYEVSVSGLIINVIVLPFVSLILILVILVCILGMIFTPLATICATGCQIILWCFEHLFTLFDNLGNTSFIIGHISVVRCLFYYVGFLIIYCIMEKVKKRYVYLGIMGLFVMLTIRTPKELEVTFLDVGQGDCIVIEYHELVCVIDAGSSSKNDVGTYIVLPFLKYQGIREIDYLFLTHSDDDHINGVRAILNQSHQGIRVKNLVISDEKLLFEYGDIGTIAQENNINICAMKENDFIQKGELSLECVGPKENLISEYMKSEEKSKNEISLVLYLQYKQLTMLFPGDTEGMGEENITNILKRRNIQNLSILKVSHHGSKNSTSEEFLQVIRPEIGIISCGKNNRYNHPHEETINRLQGQKTLLLMTKECGAITIKMNDDRLEIKH